MSHIIIIVLLVNIFVSATKYQDYVSAEIIALSTRKKRENGA